MTGMLAVLAALNAVTAGAFLAFSTMVSPAFRAAADERAAIAVMRDINRRAPRSVFMVPFLGAPAAAVAVGVMLFVSARADAWALVAVATTLAAFVVSVVANIPWNERLEGTAGDPDTWRGFVRAWPRANAVRTVLSLVGVAAALVAAVGD